ncbi:hypothetical protein RKD52_003466 [Metabacillus sp. SLBN-84]
MRTGTIGIADNHESSIGKVDREETRLDPCASYHRKDSRFVPAYFF